MLQLIIVLSAIASCISTQDFVITPFGHVSKDCMREIENGAHIIDNDGEFVTVVSPSGKSTQYSRCNIKPRRTFSSSNKRMDAEGWQVYASYNNENNATFDGMYGYWNVPDAPAYWPFPAGPDQHVIYLFTALQSDNWVPFEPTPPPGFDIIQPVLQYGFSDPNGGGSYWGLASWYLTLSGDTFWSPLIIVNPGDTIYGNMTRIKGDTWYISTVLERNGNTTALTVTNPRLTSQPWAYVVLEVYAVYECDEFPTESVKFDRVTLYEQNVQVIPTWTTYQGQQPPLCTEAITVNTPEQIVIDF